RLRYPCIPHAVVGRHAFPYSLEGNSVRNVQVPGEIISSAWSIDDSAPGLAGCVQSFLKRSGIVRFAVAPGSEIADRVEVRRLCRNAGCCQTEECEQRARSKLVHIENRRREFEVIIWKLSSPQSHERPQTEICHGLRHP